MGVLLVNAVLLCLVLIVLLPVSVFTLQVVAAGFSKSGVHRKGDDKQVAAPFTEGFVVLVPAHDEAMIIGATLANIQDQLRPQDRILVIADNCSDNTESFARAAGVDVVRRTDPLRRGKGYALAHGVQHLRDEGSTAVIIVIDADCSVAAGALQALAARCALVQRPVQALYLMEAAPGAGTRQNISLFAWRVKNRIRARGAHVLGWPCQLTGAGMAFPSTLLDPEELAHGGIVEDMQLGAQLTMRGHAPAFFEDAVVTSTLAATRSAETSQRLRWEQGHLGQIARMAPRLVHSAWRERDPCRLALGLDLLVPPLALLAATGLVMASVVQALALASLVHPAVASAAALTLLLCVASLLLVWWRDGRDLIAARALPGLAGYVLRKSLLHATALMRKPSGWVKTNRGQS